MKRQALFALLCLGLLVGFGCSQKGEAVYPQKYIPGQPGMRRGGAGPPVEAPAKGQKPKEVGKEKSKADTDTKKDGAKDRTDSGAKKDSDKSKADSVPKKDTSKESDKPKEAAPPKKEPPGNK